MPDKQYTIYHNPRCRKSRETLDLLMHHCKNLQVIDYLRTPPTEKDLRDIVKKLGINPSELVRKKEEVYKLKFKNKELSEEDWIKAMVKNPILIERPIVILGDKAVIGRPPENVLSLI
jgi:arsenate reductase